MIVPKRSMCEIGFSVRRPARSAVSSPRRSATTPCMTSCAMIANMTCGATIQIVAMVPLRSSDSVRTFRRARASRARMKRAMHLAQVALREMSVNLRGRDVAVPEHLLHGAEIGTALEQMRRKTMAQRMRTDPRESRIIGGPSFERLEKSLAGHRAAEPRDEYGGYTARNFLFSVIVDNRRIENLVAAIEVGLQRANRGTAHRHHPLLAALAKHDDRARREVHLIQLQTYQLGDPQAASVGHFEHRALAKSASIVGVDRGDEVLDVAGRQSPRQFARMRSEFHSGRGIALEDFLVHQLARETTQACEMPSLRTDGKSLVRERFEVRGQRSGVELCGLEAGITAPCLEEAEVVRIRLHRMPAEAALDGLARQMPIDQIVPVGGAHAAAPVRGFCSTFSSNPARSSRIRSRSSIFRPSRSLT